MAYRKRDPRGSPYKVRPAKATGLYLPEKEYIVRRIAARGATDDNFELMYGLPRGTIASWAKLYPGFAKALEEGRSKVDGDVLFSLYRNAIGFEYEEEQAVGGRDPCVLKVKKVKHGEVSAQKYWLNNRQPDNWKQRERVDLSGNLGLDHGIKTETRNELIDSIVALVSSKPDGKTKPGKAKERER